MIEKIDSDLRNERVPIPQRPMRAASKLAVLLNTQIGVRDGDPTWEKVAEWYSAAYGDRLAASWTTMKLPIVIRGDIQILRMKPRITKASGVEKPAYDWVLGSGNNLAESLTPREMERVKDLLQVGWIAMAELMPLLCDRALGEEETVDLKVSLDQLVRDEVYSLGLSKWHSLQAAEKSLKGFIRSHQQTPPRTHNLFKLNRLAVAAGLTDLSKMNTGRGDLLSDLDCPAGVRYGETRVDHEEAVSAHHSAIVVASAVAAKMRIEARGLNWLSSEVTSPAQFILKRVCHLSGIKFSSRLPTSGK